MERRPNKYPGRCSRCGGTVAAHEGELTGSPKHWNVWHSECAPHSSGARPRPVPSRPPASRPPLRPAPVTSAAPTYTDRSKRKNRGRTALLVAVSVVGLVWVAGRARGDDDKPTVTSTLAPRSEPRYVTTAEFVPVTLAPSPTIPVPTLAPPPAPLPTAAASPAPVPQGDPPPQDCGPESYINVDGNCIPSPVQAPTAPAGATAQCRDGTWSFSQHRQGTCSHHGGVDQWL